MNLHGKCTRRCLNKRKCSNLINLEDSIKLRDQYQSMSSDEKCNFLVTHVSWETPNSQRKPDRQYTIPINGRRTEVCKPFFLKILGTDDGLLRSVIQRVSRSGHKQGPIIKCPPNMRGKHLPIYAYKKKSEQFMEALAKFIAEQEPEHSHYQFSYAPKRR